MPTNGFSIKSLKVKLLAGEQIATELKQPLGLRDVSGFLSEARSLPQQLCSALSSCSRAARWKAPDPMIASWLVRSGPLEIDHPFFLQAFFSLALGGLGFRSQA